MQSEGPIFIHLNIAKFKTQKCQRQKEHDFYQCFFYHNTFEKRRNPFRHNYNQTACKQKPNCSLKKQCDYSHSYFEQIYHPQSYKKKYCQNFMKNDFCNYGIYCAFAHSDNELKIQILHSMNINVDFLLFYFKSEFCPFQKINHDKFSCVYAHNYQDFKRPYFRELKCEQCPNWDINKEINQYQNGCKDGFDCVYCHGWKELEFHKNNFKQNKCQKKKCQFKNICPFHHKGYQDKIKKNKNSFFYYDKIQIKHQDKKNIFNYMQSIDIKLPQYMLNQNYQFIKSFQTLSNLQNQDNNQINNNECQNKIYKISNFINKKYQKQFYQKIKI